MKAIIAALIGSALLAQSPVNQSAGPPPSAAGQLLYYVSGTDYVEYQCWYPANVLVQSIAITSISKAAAAVVTTTSAHGIGDYTENASANKVHITISGLTGESATLNGTWLATVTGASTFTVPVNTSAYVSNPVITTIRLTTRAPLTSGTYWAIRKLYYNARNNVAEMHWASKTGSQPTDVGATGGVNAPPAGSAAFAFACASRATYGYQ